MKNIIDLKFFSGDDVTRIAKQLLGKTICCSSENKIKKGVIVETEAYSYLEKGCHAFNNRRTKRTEIMFGDPGYAYVYLCYGIHRLFNIVTNQNGFAEAVLIRAVEPLDHNIGQRPWSGPGKLTKGLGIELTHNGVSVCGDQIWLENGINVEEEEIVSVPRIGIDYAEEDAALPWRYYIHNNKHVSKL